MHVSGLAKHELKNYFHELLKKYVQESFDFPKAFQKTNSNDLHEKEEWLRTTGENLCKTLEKQITQCIRKGLGKKSKTTKKINTEDRLKESDNQKTRQNVAKALLKYHKMSGGVTTMSWQLGTLYENNAAISDLDREYEKYKALRKRYEKQAAQQGGTNGRNG